MDNKKKNIIIFISCVAAVAFSIGVAFLGAKLINFALGEKEYEGVVVDGNYVDNEINNGLSFNHFTRIGDKLYYLNYSKGLYEISEEGAKRIYGGVLFDGYGTIRNIGGELYCEFYGSSIKKYDRINGNFVDQSIIENMDSISVGDILVERIYDEEKYIYRIEITYKGEHIKTVEYESYQRYCISDDLIYHISDCNEIWCFNVKEKTEELVFDLGDNYWIFSLFVEDGKLIFDAETDDDGTYKNIISYVFCIDLNDEEKTIKTLFETEKSVYTNVCDNKVYISSWDGTLTKIDLESFEQTQLCKKKSIYECYIVDDKWVYFIDGGSTIFNTGESLWRVTQDGSVLEKVFG